MKILHSTLDASVNFVNTLGLGQALESRYVRRTTGEVTIYLSTQTACAQRCRFCHLTTTGQVNARDATENEISSQACKALDYYGSLGDGASLVNFNFMARGEPLENHTISWPSLFDRLAKNADAFLLMPRFKISTILPANLWGATSLAARFGAYAPDIYYSLYSVREDFRQRWMPAAAPAEQGLELLAAWQRHSHKIPRIHLALIEGENDHTADLENLAQLVRRHLTGGFAFNIVRYNPPDTKSREGDWQHAAEVLAYYGPTQVVSRVGEDVFASCGMFHS